MLRFTVGVVRANNADASGDVRSRQELPPAGAKVERELARAKPELAETAREQRAPRGVAADREGKALKAKILWADVA
jgi:hypothetical protein